MKTSFDSPEAQQFVLGHGESVNGWIRTFEELLSLDFSTPVVISHSTSPDEVAEEPVRYGARKLAQLRHEVILRLVESKGFSVFIGLGHCLDLAWEVALACKYRLWLTQDGFIGWTSNLWHRDDHAESKIPCLRYLRSSRPGLGRSHVFSIPEAHHLELLDHVLPRASLEAVVKSGEFYHLLANQPESKVRIPWRQVFSSVDDSLRLAGNVLPAGPRKSFGFLPLRVNLAEKIPPALLGKFLLAGHQVILFHQNSTQLRVRLQDLYRDLSQQVGIYQLYALWRKQVAWSTASGSVAHLVDLSYREGIVLFSRGTSRVELFCLDSTENDPIFEIVTIDEASDLSAALAKIPKICASGGSSAFGRSVALWARFWFFTEVYEALKHVQTDVKGLHRALAAHGWSGLSSFLGRFSWLALQAHADVALSSKSFDRMLVSAHEKRMTEARWFFSHVDQHLQLFMWLLWRVGSARAYFATRAGANLIACSVGFPGGAGKLINSYRRFGARRARLYCAEHWPELWREYLAGRDREK